MENNNITDTRIHKQDEKDDEGYTCLKTLWKKDAKGSIRIWSIGWNEDGTYKMESGIWKNQKGDYGKIKTDVRETKPYKNEGLGTVGDRARKTALSKWTTKAESHRSDEIDETIDTRLVYPSACKKWESVKKKSYPYIVQKKLDGNRALSHYTLEGGTKGDEVVLLSRNMKEYFFVSHLRSQLKELIFKLSELTQWEPTDFYIDGEVYLHNMPHQEIRSRIQQKTKPHKNESVLEYHVFDLIPAETDKDMTTLKRFELLDKLKSKVTHLTHIKFLDYKICKDESDTEEYLRLVESEGYEGLVLRQPDLPYIYKNKHNRMLKMKSFEDAEGVVIGGKEAEGSNKGCIVWRLRCLETNTEFNCSQKGSFEHQRELFDNLESHIGEIITYKFYGRSNDGVPIMPDALGFRSKIDIVDGDKINTVDGDKINTKVKKKQILDNNNNVEIFNIAITGKLWTSRNNIKELIQNEGFKFSGSLTKNTTHLVTNDVNSNSSKMQKAKSLGIKIVDEKFLLDLLNIDN